MSNFLKNKTCLFIGTPDCAYTKECINELYHHEMLPTIVYNSHRGEKIPKQVLDWQGDLILSYRNYWLMPSSLINNTKIAALNFHPATPNFPGSGAYNWALYEDVDKFGITVHFMNEKIDNGKIIKIYEFPITGKETLKSLITITKKFSVSVFKDFLDLFNRTKSISEIHDMNENPENLKWIGRAKTIKDLDQMRKLDLNSSSQEFYKRIKSFHTDKFPVYIEKNGFVFKYSP